MELEHKMNLYREHIKYKSYCKNYDESITTFMCYLCYRFEITINKY